jgi:WXG100 family type VII secretion target
MTDEIRMDYGLMEDMSKTFQQSVEQLQDTLSAVQNLANEMEDGALLGRGGDAFTEALRNKLSPAISRLIEKFEELAKDVTDAMGDMQEADASTQGMY